MANPYLDIIQKQGATSPDNPYVALTKNPTDVVGSSPRQVEKTSYAKILDARAAAKEASAAADKANSFGTLLKETITGLPEGAMSIGRAVANDPKQAAYEAAMGIANGVTLGGVDYLQRKAFTNAFKDGYQGDMTDQQIEDLARHTLGPTDPAMQAIRGGAEFASILVPYAGTENLVSKGLAYAAPGFVKQYGTAARVLTNIGAWNAIGQTEESLKPADERNRKLRALIDTGLGVAFPVAEMTFRAIRPTVFNKPVGITPVSATENIVHEGEVLSQESLVAGANEMITRLEAKGANLSVSEAKTLTQLKANIENPEELYKIAQNGIERPNIGDARAVVQTAAKEGEKNGLFVATNDVDALKNFIKGSNEITYKQVDSLGKDLAGNEILARHEFNPTTGTHTIYATSDVTASTLAHELGHYFDKDLTKTVDGLSRILPAFQKNRAQIEDALTSLAVQRLGGEATGKQISSEIADIARKLIDESKVLSAARLGGTANPKISEQFADAVSQILTREGASSEAPTLSALLKETQARKLQKSLGDGVAKELESSKQYGSKATDKTIATAEKKAAAQAKVEPQKFDIVSDTQLGKVAVPRVGSTVKVSGKDLVVKKISQTANGEMRLGVYDTATRKRSTIGLNKLDNIGILQGMAKSAKGRTRVISIKSGEKVKEVPKQLDRTPTGKKPDTIDFRAEKITADQETETFLNTKVLPKITGKERIGKSNEDIIVRSLSSKMTEDDFNKILTERLGNTAEDVVKAKRIINDRVQSLRDSLAGRDINELSATEMKGIAAEYEKLVETLEVFAGVRTELSNAFRSLGLEVVPGENDALRNVVEQMQKVLGKEGDNFTFLQKALKLRENDWVDRYFNIWYPSVLSGPKTTIRNIVGTGSNLVTETAASLFTREGRREFLPRINAIVQAQKDAWNAAGELMKNKKKIASKFDDAKSFRSADFEKISPKLAFLNNVEFVGRFLNAQDIFFSTVASKGEVAAMRAGKFTYGLEDRAVIDALDEAVSVAYAQRITYRNAFENSAIDELGKIITNAKNSENSFLKAGATIIFPFVKTVANVMDRQIDYIPIMNLWRTLGKANYAQRATRIVKAAGLTGNEADRVAEIIAQRLKHQQMGKMYFGLAVTGSLVPLAMAGRITGSGPKNKNERDTLMLKGWRPNSIILPGGVVLPYQYLGPLAGILTIMGNLGDGVRYNNDDNVTLTQKVGDGIRAIMQSQLDQSFLSGLSNINDMINGYQSFEDTVKSFAANTLVPIPAAWSQTKDIIFPERFEADTFWEHVQNKVGLTGNLQPKLDTFGNQMSADLIWGLTPKLLNTEDPVLNWMQENDIFIGKPNKKQTIKDKRTGEKREMTAEEYTQFLSETGQAIYNKMEQVINSGTLDSKDQDKKKAAVQKIVSDIRAREKGGITF